MNFTLEAASTMGTGSWISIGIFAFLAVSVLFGVISGLRRGFTKTLVRIATLLAAVALAFFLTGWCVQMLNGYFEGKTLEEAILSVWAEYETAVDEKTREIIASFDAETAQLIILGVTALIVSPFAFMAAFGVIRCVMLIVDWIVCALLRKSNKNKGTPSTLLGALLGVVQGGIIALAILVPLSGMLTLAGNVKTDLLTSDSLPEENKQTIETFYATYLDEAIENPVITTLNQVAGEKLYTKFAEVKIGEKKYNMTEHASSITEATVDAIALKSFDWKSPNPEQKAAITRLVNNLSEDDYTAPILAGILRGSSKALTDNIEIFGLEAPYDDLFCEAFAIFITSDETNLNGDLNTMLEVYFLMTDNDILVLISGEGEDNMEALKNKLTTKIDDKLLIDVIIDTLQENDRTSALVTLFTKLSVSIMADSLGLDADAVELYENVKDDFKDILSIDREGKTEEEYKAEVTNSVAQTLQNNNIDLAPEIVDGMSDYIVENYADLNAEDVTDEAINDAILSYYSAYVDYIGNGGEMPELPETPEDN